MADSSEFAVSPQPGVARLRGNLTRLNRHYLLGTPMMIGGDSIIGVEIVSSIFETDSCIAGVG